MRYHIVGIAGAGMNAIAHMLLDQGYAVSGSDLSANRQTAALAARGATLHVGHDPRYVAGADVLLATSAVRPDHPELAAAQALGIPVRKRADLWRDWSQQRRVIAIAGTHGKTTTTAMMALVLTRAGLNPGFLIGGDAPDLGVGARWGDPAAPLIIEADEYDRTFLALTPEIAVITNIEWDHPDIYPTEAGYHAAFAQFATQARRALLLNDELLLPADTGLAQCLRYGLSAGCDYQALAAEGGWRVEGYGRASGDAAAIRLLHLQVPGLHNVRNALAVIAVADQFGLAWPVVAEALGAFRGTARRFELKGEVAGITVIDDYAHHPTEVRATLAAARAQYGTRRLVAYVQPHTYSRTSALLEQWPAAFAAADLVLVGDVYAAREQGDPAGVAQALAERIAAVHPAVAYVGPPAAAAAAARTRLRPGDVFITLGAGDSHRVGEWVIEEL